MLRNIHLHGSLAKTFGETFRLDVASAGEAGRALGVIVPGFRDHVRGGFFRVICGSLIDGIALGPEDLNFRPGKVDIHIVPVVQGAGRRGLGKIIAGVFLIGAAFLFPGAVGALAGGIGLTTANVAGLGVALALGGLGQMLAPTPKSQEDKNDSSYLFNGGPNRTTEGGPVPLVYGRFRVPPVIVGAGISTEDIAV